MRLIRLILMDFALTLLAPDSAHAMTIGRDPCFRSASKAQGSLLRIPLAATSIEPGADRDVSRQISQAATWTCSGVCDDSAQVWQASRFVERALSRCPACAEAQRRPNGRLGAAAAHASASENCSP